ncbi:MAG: FkbM family methyltransferase [Sphingobacteriaceae bacterium]|nr:FkbM family methyltransferase [Sphingobacteriaceae bacterium]
MKTLFKKIYDTIPFKKNVFSVLKLFYKPPHAVYKHLHFKGVFTVKIDSVHKFKVYHPGTIEENDIFWNGLYNGWEKKSMALWLELVKGKGKVVFDIGANTGLYGLVAKCLNPANEVHCFEPLPGVFKILSKNTSINSYDIKNHLFALSDYNGKAKVYLPQGSQFAYSVTVNKNTLKQKNVDEIEIDVMQLSTFIENNKITSIDLIKMDVETHEAEVLNGMGNYLKEFKPTFLIEVLNKDIAEKLNGIFNNIGYLYFNIDDKNNSIRRVDTITKSDYWNFLICNEKIAKELKLI